MNAQDQLAAALETHGAESTAAKTMAAQLLKRAAQIAAERHCEPEEALAWLLRATIAGRHGERLEEPMPGTPPV